MALAAAKHVARESSSPWTPGSTAGSVNLDSYKQLAMTSLLPLAHSNSICALNEQAELGHSTYLGNH